MLHVFVSQVARIHQSRVFLFKWSKTQMACYRWRQSGCTALILGPKEWIWQQDFVNYWRLIPSQVVKIITRWKGKPCNQTEKKAQLMKSLLKSLSSWSIKFGGTENWILLLSAMQRSETSNNANSLYNIFSWSHIFEMHSEAQGWQYCCSLECCFSRKGNKKWIFE